MSTEPLFFRLRLPPDLKTQVEQAAVKNNRSMNAEILARLFESFAVDDPVEGLQDQINDLERRMDQMNDEYDGRFDKVEDRVWRLLEHAGLYDPNPPK